MQRLSCPASPPDAAIPILMYHEVSPTPSAGFDKYVVSPAMLARQMQWLADSGYESISLDRFHEAATRAAPLPARPVIITFDDGFRDCLDLAPGVLLAHGFTATFFLVAGLIGRTSQWLVAERGCARPMAAWPRIRELRAAGFEFGGHSLTHPRLASLHDEDRWYELMVSRLRIEDGTSSAVAHLSYPFGSHNRSVREIAGDAGYRTACTVDAALARLDDDPMTLRRVPVLGHDSLADFARRLGAGHAPLEPARQLAAPRP